MASEPAGPPGLTIDEVAREAGTTTRNVRAYQTRGLLPPPTLVGRVGYYGDEHLVRLRLIARLQERGYSLAAIDDLVHAWSERRSLTDLLGFEREFGPHDGDEREAVMRVTELVERFPTIADDDDLVARAVALGIAVPTADDADGVARYRIPSPRLLDVGQALVQIGVPLAEVLDVLADVRRHADEIAAAMVGMFARHVIAPWAASGQPLETLPDLLDRIRRTQPLPLTAMNAVLAQALEREVRSVLASLVPRRAKPR
ncbi:MAG TPA: MerR family transcriptional regulator [Nannocystaceae bacterium]|nr:MerR family transcriptional regulator [Nannocystaceae bacterium]